MRKRTIILVAVIGAVAISLLLIGLVLNTGFVPESDAYPDKTRAEAIPAGAIKMTPQLDLYPPLLHLDLWEDPVPLEGPINTAGAEDSAFITPDGSTIYFFFTPNASVPANEQLFDEVTGIWRSDWNGTGWDEPTRVWLQNPGELALDGAPFVLDDEMWFASAREGYTGVNLFTASYRDQAWRDWRYAGDLLNEGYQVGEMHLSADGTELYFHSDRPGTKGQYDLWVSHLQGGSWQAPVNLEPLNTPDDEGWPFLSEDGQELWFTRTYMGSPSVWRSILDNGTWGAPELVLSSFAAEPTLDREGNLYFIHHFVVDGNMVEADVYVAYRK